MDILERLSEYNPPDRVSDEVREIAIDIQDAKNEIERLREALKKVELRSGETHIVDLARSALQQKDTE